VKRASAESRKPGVRITAYRVQLLRERSVSLPRGRYEGPEDAVSLFRAYAGIPDREHLVAIWLDARRRISGIHTVTVGALAQVDASPREVFKAAILAGADALVLVHNHPSGDPAPTPEDVEVTERLANVGELIGIPVLDHVIVGDPGWASLRSSGLIQVSVPGMDDLDDDEEWTGVGGTRQEDPAANVETLLDQAGEPRPPAFLAVPGRTVTLNPIITIRPDPSLRPYELEPLLSSVQNRIAAALDQALRNAPAKVHIEDVALSTAAAHPVFPAAAGAYTFSDTTAVAETAEALMKRTRMGDVLHDSTGRAFRWALYSTYVRVPCLDLPVSKVFSLDGELRKPMRHSTTT
jgi:DNA repair protein RadC